MRAIILHTQKVVMMAMMTLDLLKSRQNCLRNGAFLGIIQLVQTLESTSDVLDDVPLGKKEDMYFVVDNTDNLIRRKRMNDESMDESRNC